MAKEKPTRKTAVHQRYYVDGVEVPGVTTILRVLGKPALVPWANRLGLNGIDVTKYVDDKADIGTCAHYLIECDVKDVEPDLSDYSPNTVAQAENGYLKWLEWKNGKVFEPIASELQLVSHDFAYGGTADIYANVNGKRTLIDIKTSGSGIYPDMEAQTSAYWHLLKENGYEVDEVYILRVGRDESEGFEERKVNNIETYFDIFVLCREIYDLKKVVKWH